jgi:ABC-2 type transport system ATP-binding protein
MIQVENVSKTYGTVTAVEDVSFDVAGGQILGFLGSDGAGKTTLLRMIAAMIRPAAGRIRIAGLDSISGRKQVKTRIGYMPQRFGLYQDLTVEENIEFFMDIYGIAGAERSRRKQRYLGFSNLLPFLNRPAGALSGGMKQKLGLACVLVHQPDVLVLDEPTNGVDPVSRQEFWDILAQMRSTGMTILVSTAYMDEGEKCDRLVLMHAARVLAVDTPRALQGDHPDLEQAIVARLQAVDRNLAEDRFGI